jgi:hypothetical protein
MIYGLFLSRNGTRFGRAGADFYSTRYSLIGYGKKALAVKCADFNPLFMNGLRCFSTRIGTRVPESVPLISHM